MQEHSQDLLLSFSRAGADVVGAAFSLVMIVILPILSFYCLKDGRLLSDKLLLLLAPDDQTLVRRAARSRIVVVGRPELVVDARKSCAPSSATPTSCSPITCARSCSCVVPRLLSSLAP